VVYAVRSAQLQRGPRAPSGPQNAVFRPAPPAAGRLTGRLIPGLPRPAASSRSPDSSSGPSRCGRGENEGSYPIEGSRAWLVLTTDDVPVVSGLS
jgi:hypothetical protein